MNTNQLKLIDTSSRQADYLSELRGEIRELYVSDGVPWIIGYSGGKDSTAVLQLIWEAVESLPVERRTKPVYVISTDTLVENPIVASWVTSSLEKMAETAVERNLPFLPNRLTPEIKDTFWVNLIGRGYPAPRQKFRWCTERLKIKPSNNFIRNVAKVHGEVIVVLGVRKAESLARAKSIEKHQKSRVYDKLSPNASLANSLIYSPIEDWSNDDVWVYLMQNKNPWGYPNKDLLTMYQGASADGECPLVVDTSTPSCGSSRFGCWTCTLVEQDKSMSAMIQNDQEKEWMLPLLELRNELDVEDDRHLRDFRRMNGRVSLFNDDVVPGPYTQKARENWLRKLLTAQVWIRSNGPQSIQNLELITREELHEIRRIWVEDKHEIEDSLPLIYEEVIGESFDEHEPVTIINKNEELTLLKEICGEDHLHYEMLRALIAVESEFKRKSRRIGLYDALIKEIERTFYENKEDAMELAATLKQIRSLQKGQADESFLSATSNLAPREKSGGGEKDETE